MQKPYAARAGLARTDHPLFRLPFNDEQVAWLQTQKAKLRFALRPRTSPYAQYRRVGLIFVHIPKTAGTALREALFGSDVGIREIPHYSADFLRRTNPKEFGRYLSVAVMRDPATRLASTFNFLKAGMAAAPPAEHVGRHIAEFQEFGAYVEALKDPSIRAEAPWRSQSSYVTNTQGDVIVDLLLCQERLAEGVRELETHLRRKIDLSVTNVSPGKKVPVPDELIDQLVPGDRELWQQVFECGHLWIKRRKCNAN